MLCLRQFPGAEGGCVSRDCREAVLYGGQDGAEFHMSGRTKKGYKSWGGVDKTDGIDLH